MMSIGIPIVVYWAVLALVQDGNPALMITHIYGKVQEVK